MTPGYSLLGTELTPDTFPFVSHACESSPGGFLARTLASYLTCLRSIVVKSGHIRLNFDGLAVAR